MLASSTNIEASSPAYCYSVYQRYHMVTKTDKNVQMEHMETYLLLQSYSSWNYTHCEDPSKFACFEYFHVDFVIDSGFKWILGWKFVVMNSSVTRVNARLHSW